MKMINKIFIIGFIIFLLVFQSTTYAYSNDYYSISIPSSYSKIADNFFMDQDGLNINVVVDSHSYKYKGEVYTEEHLNDLIDRFKAITEEEMLDVLKSTYNQYGVEYKEEELKELSKSIKIETTGTKEITTFSKNNYKCFHFILKITLGEYSYYTNQYQVFARNNFFTLTITGNDLDYFKTQDIKNTINSFTIKNFQEVEQEESIWEKSLVSAISAMILCGISALISKKQKGNKDKNMEIKIDTEENKINIKSSLSDENEVIIRDRTNKSNVYSEDVRLHKEGEKKYCTNCGKNIEDFWLYCNHCGFKLK